MELPVLLIVGYYLFSYGFSLTVQSVLLILFIGHYVNRVFIYPIRLRTKGKQMPLIIVLSAVAFNLVNGTIIGYYLTHHVHYTADYFYSASFIIGGILFLSGLIINWRSDTVLIRLRGPGESGYKIPGGGLFDKVSCPNFFGEIIEWLGFALMCSNIAGWSFFIWTFANLVPRAIDHHRWYRNNFSNYPEVRKAVFPYIL